MFDEADLESKLLKQLDTESMQEYTQDELGFIEFILVREGLFAIHLGSLQPTTEYDIFSYRSLYDYSLKNVSIETILRHLEVQYATT